MKYQCSRCKKFRELKEKPKTNICRKCTNIIKSEKALDKHIGKQYGNWKVIARGKPKYVLCECTCKAHTRKEVRVDGLVQGGSVGCAKCAKKAIKHKDTGTRLHTIWMGIINRCRFKPGYRHVSRCNEWDDYLVFKKWALENGYKDTLTIDRKDGTGNYEPSNCRWVDRNIQADNQKLITKQNTTGYRGVTERGNKYEVNLKVGGVTKYIGRYSTAVEAARAYDDALNHYGFMYRPRNNK